MTITKTFFTLGLLLLIPCLRAGAQPGTRDNSFGTAGISTVNIGESYDARPSVTALSDGRTIVVSERKREGYRNWKSVAVTRLLTNGTPDPAFGEGGTATVSFGPNVLITPSFGVAHLVQTDGKVIVGGQYRVGPSQSDYDVVLARLDATGALDPTFGQGGKLALSFGHYTDGVVALAQQSDGKFLIGGYTRNEATSFAAEFVLVRCNLDGGVDHTFGTAGYVTTKITDNDILYSLSVLADGRILAAGNGTIGTVNQVCLARYTSSGSLDSTFSGDGTTALPIDAARRVDQIALHSDGSATALCDTSGTYFFGAPFLVHLTPEGKLDTAYGTDGTVMVAMGQINNSLSPIDGEDVVVAGVRAGDSALVVRRFTAVGKPDTGFAENGTLVNDPGIAYDYGFGPGSTTIAVRSTGQIVAAGLHVADLAFTVSLLQMTAAGERETTWGGDGRAEILHQGGGNDYIWGTAVQAQGRILVSGFSSTNRTTYHDAETFVAGFTPDGSLDPSFGSGGTAVFSSPAGRLTSSSPLYLLPDGGIIITGNLLIVDSGTSEREQAFLIRLTPDGVPDASFGENGLVLYHDGTSQYLSGLDAARQDDGKILLAGYDEDNGMLVRFHSNGVVDSTFGVAGKVEFGASQATGYRMLLRPGGEIVVADVDNVQLTLRQFKPDGRIDNLFGVNGSVVALPMGNPSARINSMALQSDGRIVLGGFRRNNDQYDGFVARVTASGAMDGSFGSGGVAAIAVVPDRDDIMSCVAIQADGKILVSGSSGRRPYYFQPEESQPLLFRLHPDGSLDNTFGTAGRALEPFVGAEYHDGGQIAIQPNGKIILAIAALREHNTDVGVMRIESGLTLSVEEKSVDTHTPHLFRNSTDGHWTLDYQGADDAIQSIKLIDMRGEVVRVVEPGMVGGDRATTTFTTADLPRGAYIVRIMGQSGHTDLKLMNY